MGLRPKHRREIRDLLRVLYDDKSWQPVHTDRLISIVRAARTDVADEVEKSIAQDLAAEKRSMLALRGKAVIAAREVEQLREILKDQHAKVAYLLEALVDLPLAKAMVRNEETGELVVDHSLISDKDAKVALSAVEKILKVTGALAAPKIDVEISSGSAFELLDAVEVEESSGE